MSSDYASLKVVDLKKELRSRGLSTTGNKEELIERLNTYTQNLLGSGSDIDGFGESMTENDILEEDVLGEELDYEDDVLKKSTDLEFSSPNDNVALDIPADVSVGSNSSSLNVTVIAANDEKPLPQRATANNGQKAEKKIHLIRNRSLSLLSDFDSKESGESNLDQEAKKESTSTESSVKISIKLSQSLEERLESRKRKFGLQQEDDKKATRAARFGIKTDTNKKAAVTTSSLSSAELMKQRAERFGLATKTNTPDKQKSLEVLKSRAERFGTVVSPLLDKLSEEEKMQNRKNRFLSASNDLSMEEKKKLRAQRFNLKT